MLFLLAAPADDARLYACLDQEFATEVRDRPPLATPLGSRALRR